MGRRLLPLVIFSFLLTLAACTKEELFSEERRAATDSLLGVYFSGALYSNVVDDGGDEVLFEFDDGSSVKVSRSVTAVCNCLQRPLPSVSVYKGWWRVDGSDVGVSETAELNNLRSKLVCAAFDFDNVYLYVSNGNVLRIPCRRDMSLWGFKLEKAYNPQLPEDVECTISGTRISGKLPSGIIGSGLCPTFEYRGQSLKVGGEFQHSKCSPRVFGGRTDYVLTLFDGSTVTYSVEFSEDYPTVWLYTDHQASIESTDRYVDGVIKIEDRGHLYWDQDVFESGMQIRGRGNSTWLNFPKKPYKIKLSKKASIFGMSKNKDWALLANYSDKSLLRNTVALKLSQILGMSWTPGCFNVDVYLNGNYIGSYDFCEHKEVAKHRVDIDVEAGDCYLEIEAKKDKPVWFDTKRMNIPIMFSEPETPSDDLVREVRNYIDGFETALTSSYFADPRKGYASYVDVDSFAKNFIIQELSKNIDADLFKSLFLVKRKGGKLEFYHVWDFDLALGNCNYLNGHAQVSNGPTGWYILNHSQEGINTGWYHYMFKDPAFRSKVKEIWQEAYPQMAQMPDFIEERYSMMVGSAGRNFDRWKTLSIYVWPNTVWLGDYRLEVEYMRDFYSERLEWMNNEISQW